ncbi:MAG: hypothetical protein JJU45_04925 [Acidimicrobiia bacterium]|nr:hypothetical protein [Acidimicrobiia bacterium]
MCFSATASFAGAAVIGAAGVGALALVKERRQIPFAALPLGFGIHQALEGVTWLELDGATDAVLTGWGVHAWVLFAWALLPFYVPWSVRFMEPDPQRRRLLLAPVVVGAALAVFMLTQALQPGISVSVVGRSLDYQLGVSVPALLLAAPYVFCTCVGPAMSTYRWVAAFGLANFVAMSAAALIAAQAFSSLWCTFAAFLSLMIVGHFAEERWNPATRTAPVPSKT